MTSYTSRIPALFGAAAFGDREYGARVSQIEAQQIVDVMLKHGQVELDTARFYINGTSEKVIGQLNLQHARVDTKIYPVTPGDHSASRIKEIFRESLDALGPNVKIRVLYLHAPDRTIPFEETMEAVDELYKGGSFEEVGLSNYAAWEVAEIVGICERRGFVKPKVYEGIYNILDRNNEAELFPCLRKFGIKFCAYSTLAGGYLTGKHLDPSKGETVEPGSHFDPKTQFGHFFISRYNPTAQAVRELQILVQQHNLELSEVAIRWIMHHSQMRPDDHGVIIGASRVEQVEKGLQDCEKGPLPEAVVDACEEVWEKVKGRAHKYWL